MNSEFGPYPFLISENRRYTYDDLFRFAASFNEFAVSSRKPAAILTDDKELAVLLMASAWITGKPFVPLSSTATSAELNIQLSLTGADILFCDPHKRESISDTEINCIDAGLFKAGSIPYSPVRHNEDAVFAILFTSGSTGTPKAVPLKRRQLMSATGNASSDFPMHSGDLWLHCLPVHHIGGVSIVLRSVICGSGIWLMSGFDEIQIARKLSENTDITAVSLVPTQLMRLIEQPGFKTHDRFRAALIGGGPASSSLQIRSSQILPVIFSYGMTETCARIVSTEPGLSFETTPGCSGRIMPGNEISIRDNDGNYLHAWKSGAIYLRGTQVFDGYLPPLQNTFTEDGWFNTGDYGFLDDQGYLFIESRRDDRIVSGGENVDPAEVEAALMQLPGVLNAAVIGLPDEVWGQIVTAIITQDKDAGYTLDSIRASLKTRLSSYKLPRRVEFTDSLPVTELGKIKKNELIEKYSSE